MALREDIAYRYDGTLDGMLTCIFESYDKHELPFAILGPRIGQGTLYETRNVPASPEKAQRVLAGLTRVAGESASHLVQLTYLTGLPEKERRALLFTRLAMKTGPDVMRLLTDQRVNLLVQAVRYLQTEAHLLCGFVRFTEEDGTLVSFISPRNDVLPLLDIHFSDRFPEERFIIYDRTHRKALMHLPDASRIVPLNELKRPVASQSELDIQMLWRRFHQTIAVEGRINPRLQRNMLPLHFRPDMIEFQAILDEKGALPS